MSFSTSPSSSTTTVLTEQYFYVDPAVHLIVREHQKRPYKQQFSTALPDVTLMERALRFIMPHAAWNKMLTAKWDKHLRGQYAKIVDFERDRRPEIWQWAVNEVKRKMDDFEHAQQLKLEEMEAAAAMNKSGTCLYGCCGDRAFRH
ncbi:hypothetical protein H2201_001115 [Coniosporium apollinis]|uniref:Uncharacterized protein n=2 Tax=Coniosporium TaxID=2810619 RepID=A0ABQ9P5L9_9PEZI|nr:hypothetical protein H2199_003095 [Cladosporium sp. JES 115]KAJ9668869.1 hypothetical protein H2201_001115 [Coniosporium apollinis]